jgi:hypothetical protein
MGVLIITRPGLESFEISSLLAITGMFGFAGRDLKRRAASPVLSHLQLSIYGFFILIPTGLFMLILNIGSDNNGLTNQGLIWPISCQIFTFWQQTPWGAGLLLLNHSDAKW